MVIARQDRQSHGRRLATTRTCGIAGNPGAGVCCRRPGIAERFLAITGIEAHSIRQAAGEPGFLAGVLQFIVAHEPTLMRFCEETGIKPSAIGPALRALPLGDDGYQAST